MKVKQHENPEFQVINMDEANAKFYAASPDQVFQSQKKASTPVSSTMSYGVTNANGWF